MLFRYLPYLNTCSLQGLFVSEPGSFESHNRAPPKIPLRYSANHERVALFEFTKGEGMLLPFHTCCLSLLERFCDWRGTFLPQRQSTPHDLTSFCDSFRRRHESNLKLEPATPKKYYRSDGIEWDHGYYGARQFWNQGEWQSRPGWEVSLPRN